MEPLRRTAVGTARYAATAVAQVLGGGIIAVYLPRALGAESYARFAVAVTFTIWIEITGLTILAAALPKLIVDAGEEWKKLARTVVFASLTGLALTSVLVFVSAGDIARGLRNPDLAPLIRLFAVDFPLYVTPLCVCGILAGRRLYERRSAIILSYWIAKPTLTVLLVECGLESQGAILGSIGASVIMCGTAARLASFGTPAPLTSLKPLLAFSWPVIVAFLILRLLRTLDMFSVQILLPDPLGPAHYGVALSVSLSVDLMLFSVAVAIAPGIATALNAGDTSAAKSLTVDAYRFVLVVGIGLLAAYFPGRDALVRFVFGEDYAPSALPTALLVLASMLSALASVSQQALVGAGRPRLVLRSSLLMVPVSGALLYALVVPYGVIGAAIATTSALLCFALASALAVYRLIGAGPGAMTLVRCLGSAALVGITGSVLDAEGVAALFAAGGGLILYVTLLFLTRELRGSDLRVVLGAFRVSRPTRGRRSVEPDRD